MAEARAPNLKEIDDGQDVRTCVLYLPAVCIHCIVLGYIIIIRIREYYIRCRSMHIHTLEYIVLCIYCTCTSIRMIATPRIIHAYPCWSTFLTLVQLVPRGPSGYHPLTPSS